MNDLKRIIAFSTISQLGYMVMGVGLSQYNVALMHTVNHAYFKALLFLGAGAVIHSFTDEQDIRKMGGLIKYLPITYSVILIGTLSLLATPFTSGFYSKDLILEIAYGQYNFKGIYAYILGTLTASLTAFYSFRLISLVFLTTPNGNKQNYLNVHESNAIILIPLFLLSLLSIYFGYIFSEIFIGIGSDFFGNALMIHPNNLHMIESEFSLPLIIKWLPAIVSLLGAALALYLYSQYPEFILHLTENSLGKKIYKFLNGKYYFDIMYNQYLIYKGFKSSYTISKDIDRGLIELLGPYGFSSTLMSTGHNISKLDTGIVTTYSLYITLSLLFLLFIIFTPMLIDASILNEMRLLIIYGAALMIVFTSSKK